MAENLQILDQLPQDVAVEIAAQAAETGKSVIDLAEEYLKKNPQNAQNNQEPVQEPVQPPTQEPVNEPVQEPDNNDSGEATLDDFISILRENGYLDEETNIETLEDLAAITDKVAEKKAEELAEKKLEALKSKLGEDGQQLVDFLAKGGTIDDFLELYTTETSIPRYDGTEESAKQLMMYYMTNYSNTPDEIAKAAIEKLAEEGKLIDTANNINQKLGEFIEQEKRKRIEEARRIEEQKKQENMKFMKSIEEKLSTVDEMYFTKLSEEDKNKIKNMLRPDETGRTPLYYKLVDVLKDPEKVIKLTYLLEKDLDLSYIEKFVETRVTNKAKKKISGLTSTQGKSNNTTIWDAIDSAFTF